MQLHPEKTLVGTVIDYTDVIRLRPEDPYAYNNRGLIRKKQGDLKGAITDFSEAVRLKPDHVSSYLNRATTFDKIGNKIEAIADYQRYLDLGGGEQFGDQDKVEKRITRLKRQLK